MSVIIGQASIDERGYASGGKAGDQTGVECNTRTWYSYPWDTYFECTDNDLAKKAASYMKSICNSSAFGYDQGQRWTGLNAIVKNDKKVKGASNSEFDCSSLVLSCYALAGLKINGVNMNTPLSSWGYTGDMCDNLLATGKFKKYISSEYVNSCSKAKVGGIYLNTQCHVCMVISSPNSVVSTSSVKKSKKVKITNNAGLYMKNEKDPVGKTSIKKLSIKKGTTIEWLKDDGYGWSQVKYKNKKYWIANSHLGKSYSSYDIFTAEKGTRVRRLNKTETKFETDTVLKASHKFKNISVITTGKYAGCKYARLISSDKNNGRMYYVY